MNEYTRHYLDENDTSWTDAMNYLAICSRDDEGKTLAFINEINRVKLLFILEGVKDARKSI